MLSIDFLKLRNIIADSEASSKKSVLEQAASCLVQSNENLNERKLLQALLNREELGSTGIGHGVAIPHARIDEIESPIACFIRLRSGIDFKGADDLPVKLVFCFAVPTEATEEHLGIISALATMFQKEGFRTKLNNVEDIEDILELFTDYQANQYDN